MSKKLDTETYRILTEKEELIAFMADFDPYAPIRRINSGYDKGTYTLELAMPENAVKELCQSWQYGNASFYERCRDIYTVSFRFSVAVSESFKAEYANSLAYAEDTPKPKPEKSIKTHLLNRIDKPDNAITKHKSVVYHDIGMIQWTVRMARIGNGLYL